MPLNVDSSRALRSPNELATLVEAVLAASPNDESTWIEWKNGLALSEKAAQVAIARNILAMANRSPEVAARHAEGFAYIVIGAEPRSCGGVSEIDPADLDSGLQPYLGSDGPRWSPQYVKVQGKSVLVITTDPPRRGDRIFSLQRQFDKYLAGAIFVRRPGKTIQAEPGDIQMLADRYAAVDRPIALHVRPVGADDSIVVRPIGNLGALLDEWESRVRRELMPPPRPPVSTSSDEPDLSGLGGFTQAIESIRSANSSLGKLYEKDQRTDTEFKREIERYIKELRNYYIRLALARLADRGASQLSPQLVNVSDRNYADVRIELLIPKTLGVRKLDTESDLPSAPKPPRPRGARTLNSIFGTQYGSSYLLSTLSPNYSTPVIPDFFFDIDRGEHGTTVSYDVRRVRAEARISLEPVLSLISTAEATGDSKIISWAVTTSNVDGIARGDLAIRVGDTIEAATLIPELLPDGDC